MSTPAASRQSLQIVLDSFTTAEARSLIIAVFAPAAPSFDVYQHDANSLRSIVSTWSAAGAVDQTALALNAARIVSQRAPVVPPAPMPAPPVVVTAADIPVFVPPKPAAPAPIIPTPAQQFNIAEDARVEALPEVAALRATIAAAVEEQEPAPIAAPIPLKTPANVPTRVTARSLFADVPKIQASIPQALSVLVYNSTDAPAVDPVYAFDADNLALALGALACTPAAHAWLGGPRGTGKTEFARQIAARLGRPFFRVNFNRSTEAADILGDMGLHNGNTHWCDGPVAQAVRTPGAILLLDEPTYSAQGHLASLNPVLERDGATVRLPRTGERLAIAADVAVYFADNTFGHGDTSGEYIARAAMGADTLDRVSLFLQFSYLPADVERGVLRSMVLRTCGEKAPTTLLRNVCKVMQICRSKADAGELSGAPSLRRAAAFAVAMVQGIAPVDAYAATVVRAAPEDSQEALRQIFAATWPHDGAAPAPDANVVNPFAHTPGDNAGSI